MAARRNLPAVAGRVYVGLVLFFLYAPILVMALMSFNASEFYAFP
jgi:spermidine/putrescine transport system permease protein